MTTTNPVSTPSATTPPATTTPDPQKELSTNFDTFLKLLTTQLQNQDPMAPMDSTQFTQQLVAFSQVEQQIDTNTNLKTLISLGQSQANNYAMAYLGKNVVMTDGTGSLSGGAANWTYGLNSAAATTTLTVSDPTGKIVYSAPGETGAGTYSFAWNGQDNNGNQLPDGSYKLAVTSTAQDGTAVTTSVASKGLVSGIDMSGASPQLVIGSTEVPLANATLVSN